MSARRPRPRRRPGGSRAGGDVLSSGICEPDAGVGLDEHLVAVRDRARARRSGVIATRYSWFLTSFGTPTFTCALLAVIAATPSWRRRETTARPPAVACPAPAPSAPRRPAARRSPGRPAPPSSRSSNGTQNSLHVGLLVLGTKSPRSDRPVQAAGEEEVHDLGGDPRRGVRRREVRSSPPASSPASSRSSRLATSSGSSPGSSISPAGSSTNRRRAGWRYCRRHSTRSSSSRASTTTAPGCSSTSRRNGSRRVVRAAGSGPRAARSPSRRGAGRWLRRTGQSSGRRPVVGCRHGPDATGAGTLHATRGDSDRRRSLTQDEAEERAALIAVDRYDIDVDLRGLLEGETGRRPRRSRFTLPPSPAPRRSSTASPTIAQRDPQRRSTSTCRRSPTAGSRCRTWPRDNVLVVTSASPTPARGAAILRTVDPSDKLVYVWTSFEPDDARRRVGVLRPARPQGAAPVHGDRARRPGRSPATAAPDAVGDDADGGRALDASRTRRRCRRTSWSSTPARSTRSASSAATTASGSTAGSRCAPYLERDAEELFDAHRAGAGVLRRAVRPAVPAGALRPGVRPEHGRRDGELGLRHLERQRASPQPAHPRRSGRWLATVLLHEMAHMWFGDLVTMRWWDDLWLNEAFASWAATWAGAEATEYTDAWADVPRRPELEGYEMDMGPATPPDPRRGPGRRRRRWRTSTRSPTPRARAVAAPAGGLRRRGGLRRGAARLLPRPRLGQHPAGRPDVGASARAAGRDLSDVDDGLARPGRHRHAHRSTRRRGPDRRAPPDGGEPRPHRLDIGSLRRRDGALLRGRDDRRRDRRDADPAARPARRPTCTCSTTAT